MNTKVGLGVAALILVALIGFAYSRPTSVPPATSTVQQEAASTTPPVKRTPAAAPAAPAPTASPTFQLGSPTVKVTRPAAAFDANSLISTSTYPTITGTANVSKIAIVVNDSQGVGIVGAFDVMVEGGHWSYPCSVALAPGLYRLDLGAGDLIVHEVLTIQSP